MKTSRALKASRILREGFAKASRRLQPYPRRLLEGFAKAPRAPPFGNDSSDNDKPPPKQSRETKFPGANGDREILFFPVQLTTSRIDNLTRLIFTLAKCDGHTYMSSVWSHI